MTLMRVTMADVAKEAKVHQTTVSLALRNDPRLPAMTRARLRDLAKTMGYKPDPMLSALNFYRSSRDKAKAQPSMAFVTRARNKRWGSTFYADDLFLRGARRACERMGYRLVVFPASNTPGEGQRLTRILRSRGISGVVLASIDNSVREFDMEWEELSALCIETQHLGLSLHTVSNNQSAVTRTAMRRMFELGYRRIGLTVGEVEEASLGSPFSAGYLVEAHSNGSLAKIPPLLLKASDDENNAISLRRWLERHRVDSVLSNWSSMPDRLKAAGYRIPQDLGVATLDFNPNRGPSAGIRQSHEIVGERAVEALALLMKTNQRGQIRMPNTILVDGTWKDGPDLPPVRP
ncbi:MAG TPA: LacI family DNA-binding transcriptional regulator [Opitutaceae bacterium]|jgi:LacI family transcriptional regulator|nr:LacI family DNA-binding transcriptional regulator [Opitutaceae bacterium]